MPRIAGVPSYTINRIIHRINLILRQLANLKKLLPGHRLPGQLIHLFRKLTEIKQNIKMLPAQKIKEAVELLDKNIAAMRDFLKTHKNDQDLRACSLVKECLSAAEELKRDLLGEISRRENTGKPERAAPAKSAETPSLRVEILNKAIEVTLDPVTGKFISKESQPLKPVEETVPVVSKATAEYRVIEILVRLLNALISRNIIESLKREVCKSTERFVELTAKDFRKIAEKVTAEIMAELDAVSKSPKEQDKFTCKITFDEKENKFRVEVSGKTNESETLKSLKGLLQSAPRENVPPAMEEAVRLIAEKPQDKATVWKLIAEVLKPSAEPLPAWPSNKSELSAPPAEIVNIAAAAVQTAQEIITAPQKLTETSPAPEAVMASLAQISPEENIITAKAVIQTASEMQLTMPEAERTVIKAALQEAYKLASLDTEIISPANPGTKEIVRYVRPEEITAAAQTLIKTVEKMLTPPAEPNEVARIIACSSEELILIPTAGSETPKQVAVSSDSTYTIVPLNHPVPLPARKNAAGAEEIKVAAEPSAKIIPFAPKKGSTPKVAEKITPATQVVFETLVRNIVTTFSNLAAEKDLATAQNNFAAEFEMIRGILEQLPQSALPVLLKEYARMVSTQPRAAEEILEPLILSTLKTEAGKEHVLRVFYQGAEKELVASTIGQKVVQQTAQLICEKAPLLKSQPSQPRTLTEVAYQVAAANQSSLSPAKTTPAKAQAFLKLVAETQKNLILIQPAKRPRPAAVADYPGARTPGYRRMPLQPHLSHLQRGKLTEASKSVRELLSTVKESGLILPEAIKSALYGGLANLSPFSLQTPAANFSLPGESRAASGLKRVLAVLESRLIRPAARSMPASDLVRTFSLSAQALLYGLIMRLVKGKISEVEDIVEALRKKKQLGRLVKDIEEGLAAEAIEAIDRLLLLADRLSRYQGYDEKALSEALEILIELNKEEERLEIPAPKISLLAA